MLVESPVCELGQKFKNLLVVGVENMRPIFVDQGVVRIVIVMSVPSEELFLFDQCYIIASFRQSVCANATGVSCADYNSVPLSGQYQLGFFLRRLAFC